MKRKINRRNLILGGGATAAAVVAASPPSVFALQTPVEEGSQQKQSQPSPSPESSKLHPPKDGDQAMVRLLAGNARFVSGKLNHPHTAADWRKRLVGGQTPFVTIIGCADSRVPPELLFDQGFGDLFVIRVAGNVIDTDVAGSVEYGVDHLATKLVVVMGHEGCGAVTAALQKTEDLEKEPNEIRSLVSKIKPAIKKFDSSVPFKERLQTSVEDNVRNSVKLLKAIPDLAKAEAESRTKIVGTVYEIETGRVRKV